MRFILREFKIKSMKGVSPLIAMVLVIAFGFTAMTIVLTVVNPMLDRAKDSGIVNEATQNMQLLDSAIKAVASEAKGSKRTIHIKITEGVLRANATGEQVFMEYEPRTRTILDGFAGDVKIESRPIFLEYFNRYNNNDNANDTWTAVNGTWSISSGRFLGTGGIAYKNLGNQSGFDISASIVRSSAPDGQVYVVPGDPRNLVLFIPFDGNVNTTITTAYDYSAYKNNGTLKNSTGSCGGTACPSWVTGKFGNATEYDGVGDYVEVADSNSLDVQTSTISAWFTMPNDLNDFGAIYEKGLELVFFPRYSSNNLYVVINGTYNSTTLSKPLDPNVWYHGAVTLDCSSDTLKFYLDGKLEATLGRTDCPDITTDVVRIGQYSSEMFNGTIDEVMVFNKALTTDEIAFLYETSIKKITTAGEIPTISEDTNVTIVLASPGSSYFDNIKLKSGPPKIRFIVPYQNIDIVNNTRFGPGDHNIVIRHYGTNTTSNRPMIGIEE